MRGVGGRPNPFSGSPPHRLQSPRRKVNPIGRKVAPHFLDAAHRDAVTSSKDRRNVIGGIVLPKKSRGFSMYMGSRSSRTASCAFSVVPDGTVFWAEILLPGLRPGLLSVVPDGTDRRCATDGAMTSRTTHIRSTGYRRGRAGRHSRLTRQADARFQDSHQVNRFTASFTRPLLLK